MSLHDVRLGVRDQLRRKDFRAFDDLLPAEVVVRAARDAAVRLGSGPLHVVNLVWLGVAAALHATDP